MHHLHLHLSKPPPAVHLHSHASFSKEFSSLAAWVAIQNVATQHLLSTRTLSFMRKVRVKLALVLPRVSQGSFFQEQMSRPVRRTAWSCRLPLFPTRPDCHWQKLLRDWSAWWFMVKPSWRWKQRCSNNKKEWLSWIDPHESPIQT